MRSIYSPGEKRKIIIEFIKKNPKASTRKIKKKTKLHVEREFKGGIDEAFKEARIKPPRTFKMKNEDERKKIIINYIRKYPTARIVEIRKDTKINISSAFKSIKDAYKLAGIKYPRKIDKRTKKEKIKKILELVKANPLITTSELMKKSKSNLYKFFSDVNEIYKIAGIKDVTANNKRAIKKRLDIINFIKENPLSTQREINKNCKTHVQELFDKGIFEAYKKAGIKFPFERLRLYGIGIKEIRDRAKTFEDKIAIKLTGFGRVNRLVKTKRGFADIIFERKGKKVIIEIKDYQNKDISFSQIKQLNKYLEDCNCNQGILICRNKPQKDRFLIGKNRIFILNERELYKIPELIDGRIV